MTNDKITFWGTLYEGIQGELDASALGQEQSGVARELCNYLEELRQAGDFKAMLKAEESLIALDAEKAIAREPHIADEMNRMERASRQATMALKCHAQLTMDINAYKDGAEYYKALDHKGYPKDSCREFLGSQGTRVRDRLRESHNDAAASIFNARSANIAAMKRLYPALQASLLEKQDRGVESIRSAQAESKRILSNQNQKAQEAGLERQSQKARSKDKDRGRE